MTPVVIRRERMVTLPADVVWQFVEPADTLPAWLPLVVRSRHVSGKGLGRRQRVTLRLGGEREVEQEVTVYQPSQTIAWRLVAGTRPHPPPPEDLTISVSMESMGPGTRIVLEARLVPASLGERLRYRLGGARRIRTGFDRALRILAGVGG